jgi:hypothetical protein
MKAAVEGLSAERAVDLARQLRDLGLEGTAIGFTSEWLRLERITLPSGSAVPGD